jgi:hypothetical protein
MPALTQIHFAPTHLIENISLVATVYYYQHFELKLEQL